ncbi:hypothetical protein FSP39_007989 [Pinctada imbricata]|uniref:Gelsolin-like domain-containing protein n=1 Tax=Pinctada imbricata TaxID=66713 RepID=A0AA88YHW0_PINIB|nr:hypothetical protein FSP39_007989 [Pinctada imbricata]
MLQLCTYLDDKPVQHREAQEKESKQFKSYFNEFTYLHGGAQSSLSDTDAPMSRLFHFHGRNMKATVKQIPMDPEKIDDSDVYILDRYTDIIQWNGTGCNNGEKAAVTFQFNRSLKIFHIDLSLKFNLKNNKEYTLYKTLRCIFS